MKRPDFDAFKVLFLGCLSERTGLEPAFLQELLWEQIGEDKVRQEVLEAVNGKVKEEYGVEFEVNQRLVSVKGPVESAIVQTFHELNTISLMERIYAKMRAQQN